MKVLLSTGITMSMALATTANADTHRARCEINDGEAIAWVSAGEDDIEIKTKAVMRVFDRKGNLIYKTSKRKDFELDAYDSKKMFSEDIGDEACWCELDLKDAEIAVHKYERPTVVHHHHAPFPPPPSIVIYKKPRRETVIVERNRPTVRVYESSRRERERVVVRPPRSSQTRVRVELPPIRVKL